MDRAAKIEYSRLRQIPAHPSKTTRAEVVGRASCPGSAIRGEPWRMKRFDRTAPPHNVPKCSEKLAGLVAPSPALTSPDGGSNLPIYP